MNIFDKLGIKVDEWISCIDDDYDQIVWRNEPKCTKEEWETAKIEIKVEYPMQLLREQRNRKLIVVDWWTSRGADGVALTQAQKDYRQALRNLPATAEPKLENGVLTNVTWPEKPE